MLLLLVAQWKDCRASPKLSFDKHSKTDIVLHFISCFYRWHVPTYHSSGRRQLTILYVVNPCLYFYNSVLTKYVEQNSWILYNLSKIWRVWSVFWPASRTCPLWPPWRKINGRSSSFTQLIFRFESWQYKSGGGEEYFC